MNAFAVKVSKSGRKNSRGILFGRVLVIFSDEPRVFEVLCLTSMEDHDCGRFPLHKDGFKISLIEKIELDDSTRRMAGEYELASMSAAAVGFNLSKWIGSNPQIRSHLFSLDAGRAKPNQ